MQARATAAELSAAAAEEACAAAQSEAERDRATLAWLEADQAALRAETAAADSRLATAEAAAAARLETAEAATEAFAGAGQTEKAAMEWTPFRIEVVVQRLSMDSSGSDLVN